MEQTHKDRLCPRIVGELCHVGSIKGEEILRATCLTIEGDETIERRAERGIVMQRSPQGQGLAVE